MALNSVKFRFEGDGSSFFNTTSRMKREMKDVQDVIGKEINQKIKQVFSVVAIEEMTRRTAEWATNLTHTAKQLQVTTDELQGFQVAAGHVGLDPGKIEGIFGTMEDAAREALKGNAELLRSFKLLGIGIDDLKNKKPTALFESVLGGLGSKGGIQGAQEIFGRGGAIELQRLSGEMGGKTGAQYGAESGMVVGEGDINSISAAWRGVIDNLKKLGTELSPMVKVILYIVEGITKMITGIVGTITGHIGDIGAIAGHISAGDWKAAGKVALKMTAGRAMGLGAGIAKFATLGFANEAIDEWMAPGYKAFGGGISTNEKSLSEGAGEGVGTLLTFGTAGVARTLGMGARGVSTTAGVMGAEGLAARTGGLAAKLSAMGEEGAWGKTVEKIMERVYEGRKLKSGIKESQALGKELGIGGPMAEADEVAFQQLLKKRLLELPLFRRVEMLSRLGYGVGALTAVGASGKAEAREKAAAFEGSNVPFVGRNPPINFGAFGAGGGGGSGNLGIGGVFGTDVGFKIMALNQTMATTLQSMLAIMEENRNPNMYQRPAGLF